jgi:hypothetical protein
MKTIDIAADDPDDLFRGFPVTIRTFHSLAESNETRQKSLS